MILEAAKKGFFGVKTTKREGKTTKLKGGGA